MILPLPVKKNRFGENVANISTANYYRQIVEEALEAHEEAVIFDHENELCFEPNISDEFWNAEAEELVDIITCCITRLNILGYDEDARQKLYQAVNEKNRKRGYFDD